MKTTIELQNGFTAELAAAGDYYKMVCNGQTIYQDSADEDCYDEADAEVFFNELIDSLGEREQGILKRAIEDGFIVPSNCAFENLGIEAENYILENTDEEDCKYDVVDFNYGGANGQQSLYWCDEHNNVCVDEWGQILGDNSKMWDYRRIKDNRLERAEWYEAEQDGVYVVVGKAVDTDGQVWILLTA